MPSAQSLLVDTTFGPVLGFEDSYPLSDHSTASLFLEGKLGPEEPVKKWLGIPYAQAERWKRPRPPTPWKEPLACHEFGPYFPQLMDPAVALYHGKPGLIPRTWVPQSEEKGFNLNVFTPKNIKEGDNLPVLVWMYGGALVTGNSSISIYDPTEWIRRESFAGRKFIVVTGNYRVNILGFLAHSDMVEEDEQGLAGNYGAYDCIAYLEWVQNNIAKFGGDPDNVTAFGESAGGYLVGQLLLCPKKLFRRGILQSGFPGTMPYLKLEDHEAVYQALLAKGSITANTPSGRLEGLRNIPATELLELWQPSVNIMSITLESPKSPEAIWKCEAILTELKQGRWNPHVESVMLGVCKDEGSLFAFIYRSYTPAGYEIARHALLSDISKDKLGALYPAPKADESSDKIDFTNCPGSHEVADKVFKVPMEVLANTLSEAKNCHTNNPLQVYAYSLNATVLAIEDGRSLGAFHSVDVPFIFNIKAAWPADSPNAKTSAALGKCWYNFAESGTPDVKWPQYDGSSAPFRRVFQQDGDSVIEDLAGRSDLEKARFKFWAALIR